MTLHVAVAAWSWTGTPSGSNRRLVSVLRAMPGLLLPGERLTLLHRPGALPDGVPVELTARPIALPRGPAPWRALREARVLPGVLRDLRADLLDLGTLPVPGGLPCPVCLTLHDLRDLDGFPRRPAWLSRRVIRAAAARAACVVVPSEFTASRLRAAAEAARVVVAPGGVDPPRGAGPSPPPAGSGYFLHVGHLEPRKNLAVVVRALARLPEAELRLAGDDHGSGRALRTLARRLGVGDRVRFLGVVPDPLLSGLYAGARAVLVPSRYEGFGLPALEGLAHGRPVLVSDRGALPEVVGAAGEVLPADDPEAWARAMAAHRGDDADEALAARVAHARKLDWRRTAAAILACWRRIAARPRTSESQPRASTIAR